MVVLTTLTVLCGCLFHDAWGLQWSAGPEDGATLYVCEGKDLTLPWTIAPGTGEGITHIQWLYKGDSENVIAVYTRGLFLSTPSYFQRVQYLANAGIALSHVTETDTGNYTVEVDVTERSGVIRKLRHTAIIIVASESHARTDATVSVRQQPVAMYNEHTNQYHVQLICTNHGHQSPVVIWTTPSEQTIQTSAQDGETFSLLLDNPVAGGNYTCRLLPDSPAASCLSRNDSVLEGDTVAIDGMTARVTLLEAGLEAVKNKNRALQTENTALTRRVQTLEHANSKRVMFHAQITADGNNVHVSGGSRIILTHVTTNQGNAYSSRTGVFTVPLDGTYFFAATTTTGGFSAENSDFAILFLMVDGSVVAEIWIKSVHYFEQATCTYGGHLTRGQRVWLKAVQSGSLDEMTTFSGFLVSAD